MLKIVLASSKEPNGITWLINCFLLLGIRCYRNDSSQMWEMDGDGFHKLKKEEYILKKWLPALYHKEKFKFRTDVELEWIHELPLERFKNTKNIYFVRDPRDSIYSRYKRANLNKSFVDFEKTIEPDTLLSKIDNWIFFNSMWLSFSNKIVIKFEDYKASPKSSLLSVLKSLNLEFSEDQINYALENSTSEVAANVEKLVSSEEGINQTVNQGGIVNRWQGNILETKEVVDLLNSRGAKTLKYLGYALPADVNDISDECLREIRTLLQFNTELNYVQGFNEFITSTKSSSKADFSNIINQSLSLNEEIKKSGELRDYEFERQILTSAVYFKNLHSSIENNFINSSSQYNRKRLFLVSFSSNSFKSMSLLTKIKALKNYFLS